MVTTFAASPTGACVWFSLVSPHLMYSTVEDRIGLHLVPLIAPSSSGISIPPPRNNPWLPSTHQTPRLQKHQYMRLLVILMAGQSPLAHLSVSFACGTLDLGNEQVISSLFSKMFVHFPDVGKLVGHTDNIRAILISEDAKYVSLCFTSFPNYHH